MHRTLRIIALSLILLGGSIVAKAQCTNFPVVNLGPDTSVCANSLQLDAGNAGLNFLWNTSDTSQLIVINASGIFSVVVTDSAGCTGTDSINVTLNPPAVAGNITISGGDTMICGNEYVLFFSNGHSGSVIWWVMDTLNWVWMPFGTGDTIDFGNAMNGINGYYQFLITTVNGNCPPDTADIFTVEMHSSPEPALPSDAIVCSGGFFIDAGYAGMQHIWNTGDTAQLLQINTSGTYYVTVTDTTGCYGTDTVHYVVADPIAVTFNPIPDTVCITDAPFQMSGFPLGGVFNGTGVNGSVFDPALAGSGQWLVAYEVSDSLGCLFWDEQYVEVIACTAINEHTSTEVNLYPNPASDHLNVVLNAGESQIEVIEMSGRVVLSEEVGDSTNSALIHIGELPAGLYTIRVFGENTIRFSRFVKLNIPE